MHALLTCILAAGGCAARGAYSSKICFWQSPTRKPDFPPTGRIQSPRITHGLPRKVRASSACLSPHEPDRNLVSPSGFRDSSAAWQYQRFSDRSFGVNRAGFPNSSSAHHVVPSNGGVVARAVEHDPAHPVIVHLCNTEILFFPGARTVHI